MGEGWAEASGVRQNVLLSRKKEGRRREGSLALPLLGL